MKYNTSHDTDEDSLETQSLDQIDEWIKKQTFRTTDEIQIPDRLLDQVIGQDKAVEVVRKAAEQKRHVMLIGDPGTGKSMVARAMTEFLPKEELEDIHKKVEARLDDAVEFAENSPPPEPKDLYDDVYA